jgi:hypothetical protein
MTGTVNQIDWAQRIKAGAGAEFDRVANALQSAAVKQAGQKRMDTQAAIAILEDKRAEVMANNEAGYFIREWQELRDQVRRMIASDPRYQTIRANKTNSNSTGD